MTCVLDNGALIWPLEALVVDPQHDNGVKMALWKVVGGDGLERDLLLVKNPCFLTVATKCISGLRSKDR